MEGSTGAQDHDAGKPKIGWSVLGLAHWGGLYHYLLLEYPEGVYPPESSPRSTAQRRILLAQLATRLGILGPDAAKVGRASSDDSIFESLGWLSRHHQVKRRGANRGVPRVVKSMATAAGSDVAITRRVRDEERRRLTSLRAELRNDEYEQFRLFFDEIPR